MVARHTMRFYMPNDETLEIFVDDELVGHYNHDEDGWDGMDTAEELAESIGKRLHMRIIKDY